MIVTIDGPAGTGKTTIAQKVALCLDLPYFDTGAMYRALTYFILDKKIALNDEGGIAKVLPEFLFEIKEHPLKKRYFVCGDDVSDKIRSQLVTQSVSLLSAHKVVRAYFWDLQRHLAQKGGVFEGRDMGSIVFPHAEVKIFLDASAEVRAQRRYDEIQKKGTLREEGVTYEKVLSDIKQRDAFDSGRDIAPLMCPKDALRIDTSNLKIEEVVEVILGYAKKLRPR